MPLSDVTSCRPTNPTGKSCDGCTGPASSMAFTGSELLFNPTVAAIDQNDRVESLREGKGCSGDSDDTEEGEKVVVDGCQDECSSGNNITKDDNAEKTYEDECCMGVQRETSQDNRQDGCCSRKKNCTEKAGRNACCSVEDEKATEGACQKGCYAREQEKAADDNCQRDCYSGETEKSNRRRSVSACCEGKSAPCCDSMRCYHPRSRTYTDRSKLHASTESRFENVKATAAKIPKVISLKQRVLPVHSTRSELVRNMQRNWPP